MLNHQKKENDEQTEEYVEIISNTPPLFLRKGITIIFLIFLVFFISSWYIKYPYTVDAEFRLISNSNPQIVTTQTSGRIKQLNISDGEDVKANQILAVIESTANLNDIIDLQSRLVQLNSALIRNGNVAEYKFLEVYSLGDIQKGYEDFDRLLVEYNYFKSSGFYEKEKKILQREIQELNRLGVNLKSEEELKKKDMLLSQQRLQIHENLVKKKVISPSEFRAEESNHISKILPYSGATSSLINKDLNILTKERDIIELERRKSSSRENLVQGVRSLLSEINKWKEQYLITSPINGKVVFIKTLQLSEYLKSNTDILYVLNSKNKFLGELKISQVEMGRIKIGQIVHVKLQGYPYQEFGYLEGKIKNISSVPLSETTYKAFVEFPNGLKTNIKKNLSLRWGMTGSAEILTDESRFLQRLFKAVMPK